MNPNDFDLDRKKIWQLALAHLSEIEAAARAEMALDPLVEAESEAWAAAFDKREQAEFALIAALSFLRETGTLDAITENFPMIMGRAG